MKRILAVLVLTAAACVPAPAEGQLRFFLRSDPRTLDPLLAEDAGSELIRYLTSGVLLRINRVDQQLQPELATSWKTSADGRQISLQLRKGVRFSDGSPFDAADVVHTFKLLLAPELHSATADAFRVGEAVPQVRVKGPSEVVLIFPAPMASAARLLDSVPMLSSRSPDKRTVAGPFRIAENKAGSYLLLRRNLNYWKRDSSGKLLPRLSSIRIGIQSSRELEGLAFRRAEIDLISSLDARTFEDIAKSLPGQGRDLGPALDQEFMWFNQIRSAKIPEHKKEWFRATAFRRAVSLAIDRADISRIAFRGHAVPAAGPYPASNKLFFNPALRPQKVDIAKAQQLLRSAGFVRSGETLRDARGNPVAFTIVTNAGNRMREQQAALIQRDLKALGIQINIVTLDFPALLERIGKTFEYEACLLGLVNVDPDPNGQMNVFLSSGANHQWNPKQAKPETPWEAEIDALMRKQSSAAAENERRSSFNRVQEILYEQQPFIYLVHPNALAAISPGVKHARPGTLRPHLLWNVEMLYVPRRGGE